MSHKIIFATGNENKVREVQDATPKSIEWKSLSSIGWDSEIPETTGTIEGNSLQKAETIWESLKESVAAEDTGLEITALNMDPGVDTAFYAGPERDPQKNMALVLQNLKNEKDRSAQFRTVFTLIHKGKIYQFEGVCKGVIAAEAIGDKGFGYDPIFIPDGADQTFGQMDLSDKKKFSHRAKALSSLLSELDIIMG